MGEFRRLIDKTHFSMAQQDVRYYLNGLLLETEGSSLRAVATDGHRLALCETTLEGKAKTNQQVILPRKIGDPMEIPAEVYYWTPTGMSRVGQPGQTGYLPRSEVERLLGEVHHQAFESGRLKGVEESAEVVRRSFVRPG